MAQFEMHEAEANLSELITHAIAGEDIVIARNGTPVARIVALAATSGRGRLRGQIRIADDFDELPDDIADAFGAR